MSFTAKGSLFSYFKRKPPPQKEELTESQLAARVAVNDAKDKARIEQQKEHEAAVAFVLNKWGPLLPYTESQIQNNQEWGGVSRAFTYTKWLYQRTRANMELARSDLPSTPPPMPPTWHRQVALNLKVRTYFFTDELRNSCFILGLSVINLGLGYWRVQDSL